MIWGRASIPLALRLTIEADGDYKLEQFAPLRHPSVDNPATAGAEIEFEDNLQLNFGFKVVDKDGDSVDGTISVNVDDDTPDLVSIEDADVDNAASVVVGDIVFVSGADGIGQSTLFGNTPPAGLTVDGQAVHYWVSTDGGTLIAYTGAVVPNGGVPPAGPSQVFTLTLNPNGQDYTFQLQQPFDGAVTTPFLVNGSSFGAGPANHQVLSTGPNGTGTQISVASGWDGDGLETAANFAAWQGGSSSAPFITHNSINGSTGGWGVDNNNFTDPEFLRFDFGTITDIDGGDGYAPSTGSVLAPTSVTFDFPHAGAGDKIAYVVHFSNGTHASVAQIADPTALLTITAPSGATIADVEFFAVDVSGGSLKVDLEKASVATGAAVTDLSFNVKLTDGDGDAETGTINVTVTDHIPTVTAPSVGAPGTVVDEKGLPDGSGELADAIPGNDTSESTSGSFSYTPGDGATTITIGEVLFTGAPQTFTGDYGTLQVTSVVGTTINYTYALSDNTLDHDNTTASAEAGDRGTQDQVFDVFAITVADTGGDVAATNLTVAINDDGPTANADALQVIAENAGGTIGGNVLTNDLAGADGAQLTHVNLGAGFVALSSGLSLPGGVYQLGNSYGVYTFKADGSWTFDPNSSAAGSIALGASFTYRLTDTDGDYATALQPIKVVDAISFSIDASPESISEEFGRFGDVHAERDGLPAERRQHGDGGPRGLWLGDGQYGLYAGVAGLTRGGAAGGRDPGWVDADIHVSLFGQSDRVLGGGCERRRGRRTRDDRCDAEQPDDRGRYGGDQHSVGHGDDHRDRPGDQLQHRCVSRQHQRRGGGPCDVHAERDRFPAERRQHGDGGPRGERHGDRRRLHAGAADLTRGGAAGWCDPGRFNADIHLGLQRQPDRVHRRGGQR